MEPLEPAGSGYADVLPAKSLTTYLVKFKPGA
jgi:hypothetical protein